MEGENRNWHHFSIPVVVYILNATLILAHEIDSAYWKEWELFHIPGIECFVLLHVAMIALILAGLVELVQGKPLGRIVALLLGFGGAGGAAPWSA